MYLNDILKQVRAMLAEYLGLAGQIGQRGEVTRGGLPDKKDGGCS